MKISQAQASLLDKWSKAPGSLSVSSIKDYNVRMNTARLLENQNKGNLSENLLTEDFTQGVGAPLGLDQGIPHGGDAKGVFAPISLALVRRVFPQLFANVLVGVQPLTGPVGLAFALRYIYKTNNPNELVEAAWNAVPRFSGYTGSTANTDGEWDAGTGVDTQSAEGWKITGPTFGSDDPSVSRKMPELGLMLSRQSIVAKTRKLAASFSLESAADIKAMQGIEMMTEMINVLQQEMTAEMDRETIGRCKSLCTPRVYNKADQTLATNDSFIGTNSQERFGLIITHIMKGVNDIRTATRRGAANIAVVSPDVATVLQVANPWFTKVAHEVNGSAVTPEMGTLNGVVKVFCDQYAVDEFGQHDNGEVLLAFKGSSLYDAGVIFCPYVTGVVNQAIDPNDFSPRVGIMTRYGFAHNMLGAENYYRLLKFNGLFAQAPEELEW
jgi:hypothetical protein